MAYYSDFAYMCRKSSLDPLRLAFYNGLIRSLKSTPQGSRTTNSIHAFETAVKLGIRAYFLFVLGFLMPSFSMRERKVLG
jgi:hypothetical protein